jgi:hypothetical protein
MSELRTRMTGTEQTGGPSLTALTEAAEAMERHLESGEYELAIDTFRAIEPRLGMAERDERKLPLVQALHELDRLAKTVIEFEAIRLDINGIAIYEDRRPVALINGTAVAEGELLGEELLVRNISPDQIEFSFRGMVLAVPVEASHDGSIPQNGRRRRKQTFESSLSSRQRSAGSHRRRPSSRTPRRGCPCASSSASSQRSSSTCGSSPAPTSWS